MQDTHFYHSGFTNVLSTNYVSFRIIRNRILFILNYRCVIEIFIVYILKYLFIGVCHLYTHCILGMDNLGTGVYTGNISLAYTCD